MSVESVEMLAKETREGLDRPLRVLVVDDDCDVLEILKSCLGETFEVRCAASGQVALEILGSWTPDTVVTDIRMPDMNGFMLLQEIARLFPGLPTIAFSANIDTADERTTSLVQRYASRALSKPLYPEDLIAAIHEVVQNGRGVAVR